MWTKSSIKVVEKPSPTAEFTNGTIAACDLAAISSTITTVSFIGCRSKEWLEIGQRLATLPQLNTLSAEHCDSENSLCVGISESKSLTSLRMSK
jgi:hypothetical protein